MSKSSKSAAATIITTPETPEQEISRLRSENAALLAGRTPAKPISITYKVSALGALSVYGLGRFPLTQYVSQWARLDSDTERAARAAFVAKHKADFAAGKDDPRFAAARAARDAAAKA